MIYEGTTPTHTFTLPLDASMIATFRVIYSQNNQVVFIKTAADCTLEGNVIKVKLTQEDTFKFEPRFNVDIQVRVLTLGDDSLVSQIMSVDVARCLENEVLV